MNEKVMQAKPYAGNPYVRFGEGQVALAATPRLGPLLYTYCTALFTKNNRKKEHSK